MVKESKVTDIYQKPNSKPIKPKKFNLQEEEVKHGWAKNLISGYNARNFGGWEFFHTLLGTCALGTLQYYRGSLLNFDPAAFLNTPPVILIASIFTLLEVAFYFMFVHGTVRKLSALEDTSWQKIVSFFVGILSAMFAPIASLIGIVIMLILGNNAWANFHTKRQFLERAKYYVPEEFQKDVYEEPSFTEPERKTQPKQAPIRQPTQSPPSTYIGQPKVGITSDIESQAQYIATGNGDYTMSLPNIGGWLDGMGF